MIDSAVIVAIVGLIESIGVVIIGGIITRHQNREEKRDKETAALMDGVRTLLRNELVNMHREWVEEKGIITLESLEYAEQTYNSYHALSGNGSGDKLWNDIRSLPIKD